MRYNISRGTILEFLLVLLLLLPILSFLVFTLLGFYFNPYRFYFVIYLSIIGLSLSYSMRINFKHLNFFLLFFLGLLFTFFIHLLNGGFVGILDFFRSVSGYYSFIFLGWLLYNVYYKTDNLKRILLFVVRMAVFISIINVLHFVLLHTDNYTHDEYRMTFDRYNIVVDYLLKLNKTFYDYIVLSAQYNDVGFIRPVGYFFDMHSQYYLPLAGAVILIFSDYITKHKWVYLFILTISLLLSGIKSAYLTILLLYIISLFISGKLFYYMKRSIPILIIFVIVFRDKIIHLAFGTEIWKTLDLLIDQLIKLPVLIFKYNFLSFLFGGAPFLRNNPTFYSEIFWVSVIFYIGITGVLFYLCPLKLFGHIRNKEFLIGTYTYFIFCFSLIHYSVYMVGINNLVSAIPFMYFFGLLKLNKSQEGTQLIDSRQTGNNSI